MKTIYLMRHANTEPGRSNLADESRGLTERGKNDAQLMGQWLAKQTPQPEALFLSTSIRTGQTATIVTKALPTDVRAHALDALYLAWASELADLISTQDDMIDTLLIINHEPGLSTLTRTLVSSVENESYVQALDHFPTGAVAVLELAGDIWSELAPQTVHLKNFAAPKSQ